MNEKDFEEMRRAVLKKFIESLPADDSKFLAQTATLAEFASLICRDMIQEYDKHRQDAKKNR